MNRIMWLVMMLVSVIPLIFSGGCRKADGSPTVNEISSPTISNNSIPTVNVNGSPTVSAGSSIALPEPVHDSDVSLEQALLARRSIRDYREGSLTLKQLGQLLWQLRELPTPAVRGRRLRREPFIPLKFMSWSGMWRESLPVFTDTSQNRMRSSRCLMATRERLYPRLPGDQESC